MNEYMHYFCCLTCNEIFSKDTTIPLLNWTYKHNGHKFEILNEHHPRMEKMKNWDHIKRCCIPNEFKSPQE